MQFFNISNLCVCVPFFDFDSFQTQFKELNICSQEFRFFFILHSFKYSLIYWNSTLESNGHSTKNYHYCYLRGKHIQKREGNRIKVKKEEKKKEQIENECIGTMTKYMLSYMIINSHLTTVYFLFFYLHSIQLKINTCLNCVTSNIDAASINVVLHLQYRSLFFYNVQLVTRISF